MHSPHHIWHHCGQAEIWPCDFHSHSAVGKQDRDACSLLGQWNPHRVFLRGARGEENDETTYFWIQTSIFERRLNSFLNLATGNNAALWKQKCNITQMYKGSWYCRGIGRDCLSLHSQRHHILGTFKLPKSHHWVRADSSYVSFDWLSLTSHHYLNPSLLQK